MGHFWFRVRNGWLLLLEAVVQQCRGSTTAISTTTTGFGPPCPQPRRQTCRRRRRVGDHISRCQGQPCPLIGRGMVVMVVIVGRVGR